MQNMQLEVIEREMGEGIKAGGQPLTEEGLGRIRIEIEDKMGVGPRNIRTSPIDRDYLEMEVGILYPERQDGETLARVLESHLKPLKWWSVTVFLHPKTNRLIAEARRQNES